MGKKYYKIVDYNLMSICGKSRKDVFCVQYKIGKWVEPTQLGSSLFVFDSLKNIKRLMDASPASSVTSSYRLYEAEIKNKHRKPIFITPWHLPENISVLLKAWLYKSRKKRFSYLYSTTWGKPKGTIGVGKVKLVKKIRSYEYKFKLGVGKSGVPPGLGPGVL